MRRIPTTLLVVVLTVVFAAVAFGQPANGVNKMICFSGVSEGSIYGGTCTLANKAASKTVATLKTNGGDPDGEYAGVYSDNKFTGGKALSQVSDLKFSYTGTPTNGSPRFSIPIDANSDGTTDYFAFASAFFCNDGAGNVDVTGNPNCTIFDLTTISGYVGWGAYVAAHPGAKIGKDVPVFIISDDPGGVWTISNASFGKPGN